MDNEINIKNLGYIYNDDLTSTGDIVFLGSKIESNNNWRTGNIHYSIISNRLATDISTNIKTTTDNIINSAIQGIKDNLGNTYTLTSTTESISTVLTNSITTLSNKINSIETGTVASADIKTAVINDISNNISTTYILKDEVKTISTNLETKIKSISTGISKNEVSTISTALNNSISSISENVNNLSINITNISGKLDNLDSSNSSFSIETINDTINKTNRLYCDLYTQYIEVSDEKFLSSDDTFIYASDSKNSYKNSLIYILNNIRDTDLNFENLYETQSLHISNVSINCNKGLKLYNKLIQLQSFDTHHIDFEKYMYVPISLYGISCNNNNIDIYNVYLKSIDNYSNANYCFLINNNSTEDQNININLSVILYIVSK